MESKEDISGVGDVLENGEVIRQVRYDLQVYRDMPEGIEGLVEIRGGIPSTDAECLFGRTEMVLRLVDGRQVGFYVKNSSGDIVCSGSLQ